MKGKPIEPGCLAMIVGSKANPENNGKTVRVVRVAAYEERPPEAEAAAKQQGVRFKPRPETAHLKRWWVEPIHGTLRWTSGRKLVDVQCAGRSYQEKFLIRIDGDEEPKTVSTAHTKDLDQVI